MNFNKKYLLIIILALSVSYSFAQTEPSPLPRLMRSPVMPPPPPGNMQLLPGYIVERRPSTDSARGKIYRKDGLSIKYDIGRMAGNYSTSVSSREKQNVIWLKNQTINDQELIIVLLKDRSIYATFTKLSTNVNSNLRTPANFVSNVKTDEDLADFLLMIITYGAKDAATENKSK